MTMAALWLAKRSAHHRQNEVCTVISAVGRTLLMHDIWTYCSKIDSTPYRLCSKKKSGRIVRNKSYWLVMVFVAVDGSGSSSGVHSYVMVSDATVVLWFIINFPGLHTKDKADLRLYNILRI